MPTEAINPYERGVTPEQVAGNQAAITEEHWQNRAKLPAGTPVPLRGTGSGNGAVDADEEGAGQPSLRDLVNDSYKYVGTPDEPTKSYDTSFMDYVRAVGAGGADLIGAAGGFANWVGGLFNEEGELNVGQKWGRQWAGKFGGLSDDIVDNMSEDAQALMSMQFTGEGPSAISSVRSLALKLANTAPSLVATLGPVGLAARAGAGLAVLNGATRAGAIKAGMGAAAVTGAVTEGAIATGFTANDVADFVNGMSLEELKSVPGYEEMKDSKLTDPQIREAVLADAVGTAGAIAGGISTVSGGIGGAFLGKLAQRVSGGPVTRTAKAAITEGMQEVPQEAGETFGANKGIQEHADPTRELMEGVKESAVAGGVMGALGGGAMQGGGEVASQIANRGNAPTPEEAPPPAMPPEQAPEGAPPGGQPPVANDQTDAVAEPATDIGVQIADMYNPKTTRDSMYVSPSNGGHDAIYDHVDKLNEQNPDSPIFVYPDSKGGLLLSINEKQIAKYKRKTKNAEPEAEETLGKILKYRGTKADLAEGNTTIEATDADGNVLKSELVEPSYSEKRMQEYKKDGYENVAIKPAAQSVEERQAAFEAEAEAVASGQHEQPGAVPTEQVVEEVSTNTPEVIGKATIHNPSTTPVEPEKKPAKGPGSTKKATSLEQRAARARTARERIEDYDVGELLTALQDYASTSTAKRAGEITDRLDEMAKQNLNNEPGEARDSLIALLDEGNLGQGLPRGNRDAFLDAIATGEDLDVATKAYTATVGKRKGKVTENVAAAKAKAEESAKKKEASKGQGSLEQVSDFFKSWTDKSTNPGKRKDGGTRKSLPKQEHEEYYSAVDLNVKSLYKRMKKAGQISPEADAIIGASLQELPTSRTVPRMVVAQAPYGQIIDQLQLAESVAKGTYTEILTAAKPKAEAKPKAAAAKAVRPTKDAPSGPKITTKKTRKKRPVEDTPEVKAEKKAVKKKATTELFNKAKEAGLRDVTKDPLMKRAEKEMPPASFKSLREASIEHARADTQAEISKYKLEVMNYAEEYGLGSDMEWVTHLDEARAIYQTATRRMDPQADIMPPSTSTLIEAGLNMEAVPGATTAQKKKDAESIAESIDPVAWENGLAVIQAAADAQKALDDEAGLSPEKKKDANYVRRDAKKKATAALAEDIRKKQTDQKELAALLDEDVDAFSENDAMAQETTDDGYLDQGSFDPYAEDHGQGGGYGSNDDYYLNQSANVPTPTEVRKVQAGLAIGMTPTEALKSAGLPHTSSATLLNALKPYLNKHPELARVAAKLEATGFDVPVITLPSEQLGGYGRVSLLARDNGGKPEVDPRLAVIQISDNVAKGPQDSIAHTLLHELAHVATLRHIDKDATTRSELDDLRKRVAKIPGVQEEYGLTDVYEFVAESFSNTRFQELLSQITAPSKKKSRIGMMWDRVVNIVARATGIRSLQGENVLSAAMRLSDSIMETRQIADSQLGGLNGMTATSEVVIQHAMPRSWNEARETGDSIRHFGTRGGLAVYDHQWLMRRFTRYFKTSKGNQLQAYDRLWTEKQGILSSEKRKGNHIATRWRDLAIKHPQYAELMGKLMVESTMAGIDPRKGRLSQKLNPSQLVEYDKLRADYDGLGGGLQSVYSDVADFFKRQSQETQQYTAEALIRSEEGLAHRDAEALAKKLLKLTTSQMKNQIIVAGRGKVSDKDATQIANDLTKLTNALRVKGIYFPLRREGKYIVSGNQNETLTRPTAREAAKLAQEINSGTHPDYSLGTDAEIDNLNASRVHVKQRIVEFYESKADALNAQEAHKTRIPGMTFEPIRVRKHDEQPQVSGAMAKLGERIKRNLNSPIHNKQIDAAVIQMLAEDSARRSQLRRVNVTGASTNMQKFFAQRVTQSAWAIADLKTSQQMAKALHEARLVADAHPDDTKRIQMGNVLNEIDARENINFRDREDSTLPDLLSRAGYLFHLASPSYSLINATQVAMVTFPVVSAQYGTISTTGALTSNMGQTLNKEFLAELKATKGGLKGLPENFADNMAKKWGHTNPTEDRLDIENVTNKGEMLQALIDTNVIDSSVIQALYDAVSSAGNTASDQVWAAATTWSKSWPQFVEQVNRIVTAGAVYDLEMKKSNDPVTAAKAAKDLTYKTHGDYSDANKARVMKGFNQWSKVIFMFKTYMHFLSALYVEQISAGFFKGKTVPRAQALKTLGGLFATHSLAAGVLGGIAMQPIRMLIAAISSAFGDPDDPWDLDQAVEAWAYDRFLELAKDNGYEQPKEFAAKYGEMFTRGLPRAAGIDLFSRIGLQGMYAMPARDNLTDKETFWHYVEQALGPMASQAANIVIGFGKMSGGEFGKGLEKMSPKLVRDVLRGVRYPSDGVTDTAGVPYLGPDEVTWVHGATQAFGMTPALVARTYEKTGAVMSREGTLQNRADRLRHEFYNAANSSERKKAMKAIREFNMTNRGSKSVIQSSSLYRGIQSRRERELSRGRQRYTEDWSTKRELPWATK